MAVEISQLYIKEKKGILHTNKNEWRQSVAYILQGLHITAIRSNTH